MSALRLSRRGLFGGFAALLAAPAIVRVASIMPVAKVPDHAALHRLFEERIADFWNRVLYADGSSCEKGGLAELVRQMRTEPLHKPVASIVGNDEWRNYQHYSWTPMALPT